MTDPIRVPSSSTLKLESTRVVSAEYELKMLHEVRGFPVNLEERTDLDVNAQPEGYDQTLEYAHLRGDEMVRLHGPTPYLDVLIESGAIDGLDVAVVVLRWASGQIVEKRSRGIPFPDGALEEARRRGFKTTTAGDIIHEQHPNVPANNWQLHFPPYLSREDQIAGALREAFRDSR